MDPSGARTGYAIREALDQIYDGQRTGRWDYTQLMKTEKTHVGTLVEIWLQREFGFDDGDELDYLIAGVDRSDRAQNIRVEFGTLVRNRRGRLPHLVVVTAEPLPSRIISIARGTGEIDAVYHLLYHEIDVALDELRHSDRTLAKQWGDWREMVETWRIRPYSELAEVLASS